jgi:hypothetical protein
MKKFRFYGIAVIAAVLFVLAGCEQPDSESGLGAAARAASVGTGTAEVGDVTITGDSYSPISSVNVIIILTDNSFNAIRAGTNLTNWFTNIPNGLTAVSTGNVAQRDTRINITVSGTPYVGSWQVLAITIPANRLYSDPSSPITVDTNDDAVYRITATINSADDLAAFSAAVAGGDRAQNAKLASGTEIVVPANAPYLPISMDYNNSYTGVFDGNGGFIKIDLTRDKGYLALFGINNGTIQNLTVCGSVSVLNNAADVDYIGGVVAYNDTAGTISRVISKVTINTEHDSAHNIGGIAGFNGWDEYNSDSPHYNEAWEPGGYIFQSRNEGYVTGGFNKIGGIAGENAYIIEECVNAGTIACTKDVSGWPGVGGLVGRNGNNNTATEQGQILVSYNRGVVADNTGASSSHNGYGGITGWCDDLSSVKNCYTVGDFTQLGASVGGAKNPIIGMADNPSTAMSSGNYSWDEIYASDKGNIPLTGIRETSADMQLEDFVLDINSGTSNKPYVYVPDNNYPKLRWE